MTTISTITRDQEPIVAQCTPTGIGALAIVRISGHGAIELAEKLSFLPRSAQLGSLASHSIHYGKIVERDGSTIDQVLILLMRGPKTFTGQDTIEISCHNNPLIIERIISRAIECGARQAEAGEFAKRAYLNGKIDVAQAEAINEVIHAHTRQALERSLAQLEGSLAQWVDEIQQILVRTLALCQASFEFLDDESISFDRDIRHELEHALERVQHAQAQHQHQRLINQGIRVAIIGSVNAGKSSLFNRLVGQERAIVNQTPGTTRDVIEMTVYRPACTLTFVDTAGLRQTGDSIEQEGIRRSHEQAVAADIVVLVHDASRAQTIDEQKTYAQLADRYTDKIVPVLSKTDIQQTQTPDMVAVSAITGSGLDKLQAILEQRALELLGRHTCPFIVNSRHQRILVALERQLNAIIAATEKRVEHELLAAHINEALETIGRLTSTSATGQSIDEIFRQFCVGK